VARPPPCAVVGTANNGHTKSWLLNRRLDADAFAAFFDPVEFGPFFFGPELILLHSWFFLSR
jgi:hypothetical protein